MHSPAEVRLHTENPMKEKTDSVSSNRRNVYFKQPVVFNAFQMAVEKGIINAKSASDRLEELIKMDMRRVAPKMRAAKLEIPAEVFEK